jgi:hypothetical protein
MLILETLKIFPQKRSRYFLITKSTKNTKAKRFEKAFVSFVVTPSLWR